MKKLKESLNDDYVFIIKWHPAIYNNINRHKLQFDISKYEGFVYDFSNERDINDLLIVTNYEESFNQLKNSVKEGRISEAQINKLVFRILAWKYYKGLMFNNTK